MRALLILTTTTCINCVDVKEYAHEKVEGYSMQFIDETDKCFTKVCSDFNATQAPTVLLIDNGEEVGRAHDVEELKELLNNNQKND